MPNIAVPMGYFYTATYSNTLWVLNYTNLIWTVRSELKLAAI